MSETYLNDITIKKKLRDALVRLRFGINELRVNKRYESENIVNKDCATNLKTLLTKTVLSVQPFSKTKRTSYFIVHCILQLDINT